MRPHFGWIFVLCCLIVALPAHAQTTRTRRAIEKEYWPNGNIKFVTVTKTTTGKYVDLFNYYKKTNVKRTEFNEQGIKIRKTVRVTKLGRGGKPCYEIFSSQTDYDEQGNKTRYEESQCDKNKSKLKVYQNGKLIFVRIHKPPH
ncbi:MAG: hypothetical protein ACRCYO_00590 [Bacteroidia bacterium]